MSNLENQRVVVLREVSQSQNLLQLLQKYSANAVSVPLLSFKAIDEEVKKINPDFLSPITSICFTSVNGVNFFIKALVDANLNTKCIHSKSIYAVGPKTNEKLREYDLKAEKFPSEYSADGLLKLLPIDLSQEFFLLPIAEIAKKTFSNALKKRNAKVEVLKIYKTILLELNADLIYENDWIIFTSPSMVHHYFSYKLLNEKYIVPFSIGKSTTDAIKSYYSGELHTVPESTSEGIVEYLIKYKAKLKKERSALLLPSHEVFNEIP